ncbi:DUF5703 domain-containing protein [Paenibacillus koleovorans]|uniref:DUF5703 domain-containing protein n=1 Tax=Paenibacillus koleovorans TaxID=121608 RepID=UPI000FD83168|nr:DUF5703 domain-containing protein [Paenibacillus koleovorans]
MSEEFEVSWDSPSVGSQDSMPAGNGDIGMNVWVEENGDLLVYISKTDAWDETGRLLKLGRLRVSMTPNVLLRGPFRQTLSMRRGEVAIEAGAAGERVRIAVWCDANRPALHVEAQTDQPVAIAARLELWRTEERVIPKVEMGGFYGFIHAPEPLVEAPDTVVDTADDSVIWYHRNEHSVWAATMEHQGLGTLMASLEDPLLGLTTGARMAGTGFRRIGPCELATEREVTEAVLTVVVHGAQTGSAGEWLAQLREVAAVCERMPLVAARTAHLNWWDAFWQRSYIELAADVEAATVARGYALQRYLLACAGRGRHPIKFNGSIFTMDIVVESENQPRRSFNADYRLWGGHYWFQNTRLLYWPMLAAGDSDLMRPLFAMYAQALPLAQGRTQLYYGHEGAYFPETMAFWGTYANDNYGWNRDGLPIAHVVNGYIRYYWQGGLELVTMMLAYDAYAEDAAFREKTLLPLAEAILAFFDAHYPRDAAGLLHFEPASALETWHEAVNPTPELAGLRHVLTELLACGDGVWPERLTAQWRRMLGELPQVPLDVSDGETRIAAAEQLIGPIMNAENPELYAVFPYPLYAIGSGAEEIGRRTFTARRVKRAVGWQQDGIQAAWLGLAEEAWQDIASRFGTPFGRFPGFYGPNYDWVPDQDHGAAAMMALQSMLLQTRGDAIYVLPAWPSEQPVRFKLHAGRGTTVEAAYEPGRPLRLQVEPAERLKDVVVCCDASER